MRRKELRDLGLQQVIELQMIPYNVERYISSDFGLVLSVKGMSDITEKIFVPEQPYRLTEGRIVYMRSGYVRVRMNLIEARLDAHQLRVVSPGAVLEFVEYSPDCDLTMLAFSSGFMEGWQKENLLSAYIQGRVNMQLALDAKSEHRLESIFQLMWDVLHDEPLSRETMQALISVLFRQIECFQGKGQKEVKRTTRQEQLFARFISLVNRYAVSERNVSFYAGKLYVTPRYLCTLIRETSGRTVMDWVNDAVLLEAKLMLCHTDKLVYQIADELYFPNPSFFCKFFRRMTGRTPNQYRQGRR